MRQLQFFYISFKLFLNEFKHYIDLKTSNEQKNKITDVQPCSSTSQSCLSNEANKLSIRPASSVLQFEYNVIPCECHLELENIRDDNNCKAMQKIETNVTKLTSMAETQCDNIYEERTENFLLKDGDKGDLDENGRYKMLLISKQFSTLYKIIYKYC